ncbi:MAG: AsmA-like C-terminal domain-containing protein [Alphaproteobacteria bacterium]|nr:AsmA-like C-terminal domain-containing protein [Alphaproteobacteria bacterium]
MAKKAIHHFNRGLVIGLEIVGFCAVLAVIAWGFLLFRLAQGPMNVDFLTARLEQALNNQQSGFSFDVGTTMMVWGGRLEPFELQMHNVQIGRADGTPVLAVERVGVHLSKRRLVFGQVVPKVVRIYGPALRIIRWEDGHFTLNLGDVPDPGGTEASSPTPTRQNRIALLKGLLAQMEDRKLAFIGGLGEVSIVDAAIFYEDKILNVAWKSKKTSVKFARAKTGLAAETTAALEMDENNAAFVQVNAQYDWDTKKTVAMMAFSGFVPELAAQGSESLKAASSLTMPFKGSMAIELNEDFKAARARFVIGSDAGMMNVAGIYEAPIPVQGLYLNGQIDLRTFDGSLDRVRVDLGGPVVEARAHIRQNNGGHDVMLQGELLDMPLDKLDVFWPHKLAQDARKWVTQHLSKGVAHKATIEAGLRLTPQEAGTTQVALEALSGGIDFTNITVDYFPPLTPVKGVDGRAEYDASSFRLDLKSGLLNNMKVSKSNIVIAGLDREAGKFSDIDIAVALSGPLKTALGILDSKPLQYPTKLGLDINNTAGQADVDVTFKFPLHNGLALEDVAVTADAKVRDVRLDKVVMDYPLTGGPMDVKLANGKLGIKGSGKLGTMPITFDWMKDFTSGAAVGSRVTARMPLDRTAMLKFGVPEDLNPDGGMTADLEYTTKKNEDAVLSVKGDITPLSFEVTPVGYKKLAGTPGEISFLMQMKDGKARSLSNLNLAAEKTILQGGMTFAGGNFVKADFSKVILGDTDVKLQVEKSGRGGFVYKITGRQVDATSVLEKDNNPNSDKEAAKQVTPITVTMNVGRVITSETAALSKTKLFMRRNKWGRIEQLEIDGVAGEGDIYLRFKPEDGGGYALRLEAMDAGAALNALSLTQAVKGGALIVTAIPSLQTGPRDMVGTIQMSNFTVAKMPVLGRLLNALSLPGLFELLNGSGVAFKKMRAQFVWMDRGQPDTDTNVRFIKLKEGQTSGASLGLTFEGNIDLWSKIYDLNGTIVPVSDLNKLISVIPIVGNVLTAGGEGVFAATYTVKGPTDQPTVTVNPLAALAPGVLRKIFFE